MFKVYFQFWSNGGQTGTPFSVYFLFDDHAPESVVPPELSGASRVDAMCNSQFNVPMNARAK
jgi:hypothetical protein